MVSRKIDNSHGILLFLKLKVKERNDICDLPRLRTNPFGLTSDKTGHFGQCLIITIPECCHSSKLYRQQRCFSLKFDKETRMKFEIEFK